MRIDLDLVGKKFCIDNEINKSENECVDNSEGEKGVKWHLVGRRRRFRHGDIDFRLLLVRHLRIGRLSRSDDDGMSFGL